jgi:hypothetical protein
MLGPTIRGFEVRSTHNWLARLGERHMPGTDLRAKLQRGDQRGMGHGARSSDLQVVGRWLCVLCARLGASGPYAPAPRPRADADVVICNFVLGLITPHTTHTTASHTTPPPPPRGHHKPQTTGRHCFTYNGIWYIYRLSQRPYSTAKPR